MSEKISRRRFLEIGVAAAVGAVVAGSAVYFVSRPAAPRAPPAKPIVLGSIWDMTGFLAVYGYWGNKATSKAVDYINEKGGIDGRTIRYVMEDSASSTDVAVKKMRRLITDYGANFIIPSPHGGIAMSCLPIAKEFKVPYLYTGSTYTVNPKGNRYLLRVMPSVRSDVRATVDWVRKVGKRFSILYIDYAYGWSMRDEFSWVVEQIGGKVTEKIAIPVGTVDVAPYTAKVSKDVDAIILGMVGSAESLGAIKALRELGYEQPTVSLIYPWEGIDIEDPELAKWFEGCYFFDNTPRILSAYDTSNNRELRKILGIDEGGREIGNPRNATSWAPLVWSGFFALVESLEAVGWRGPEDTPKLIKWWEGHVFKESLGHPYGDWFFRAEDHYPFRAKHVLTMEKGKLKLVERIPYKKAITFEPEVDFTKEPF